MPTYDYACPQCGDFEALRGLAQRNDPCACPDCGAAAQRVFLSAPRLACLSGDTRRAMDVNERARHAPRSSRDGGGAEGGRYGRMRHPSGCGCCGGQRGATVTTPDGAKTFPGKRPWMISH
jgi:putative FmdB family regulatory protein